MLNPGISILLAIAFVLLWQGRRAHFYVLLAAGGHLATALGFLVQDVMPPLPLELQRIPANAFFLLAGVLLMVSVTSHYRIAVPWRSYAVIFLIGIAALCWFLLVQPSLNLRILCVSFALAAIGFLGALSLRKAERRHGIDHVLYWVCLLGAVNFMLRPSVIILSEGGYTDYDGFQQSLYWTTVQFSQALVSLILALCLMVAVAMELVDELQAEARTDSLSGLLNRRGFEQAARVSLNHSQASGRPTALLLADLDHFKQINDQHGHIAGDAVITQFGRVARDLVPSGSILGRIGGEEFAILLPGTTEQQAASVAEAVRSRFVMTAGIPQTTVSIGVAKAVVGDDLERLLQRADKGLYAAKNAGRNGVRLNTATPEQADRELTHRTEGETRRRVRR